ncbi:UNVERIFIED_CONTAM: hypothetical protein GTU68_049110 [Idotea baltica]|nr:hypothetical protein [Idotea baltica]
MTLARMLGQRGQGKTWPNPPVGCVLANDGRVVGRGWTQIGGRPHAEVHALTQAGSRAKGATAYVTLEPCAHHGKTGPCADALIKAGVARVVAGIQDPDTRVSGKGFAQLRRAGIELTTGVLGDEIAFDLTGFLSRTTLGRPAVSLKLASSFDGRIATASGHSQWITGQKARHMVHGLRARHDAVLVGAGTARLDDPALTVRGYGNVTQPLRIVMSRRLDLPLSGQLARTAKDHPVWICHGTDADADRQRAWKSVGAKLIAIQSLGGQLDVSAALHALGQEGLTQVFCEGGGALAASLLSADLVDDLYGFTAGLVIGAEGMPAVGALGLSDLGDAPRFDLVSSQQVGADVMHHWRRQSAE